ncbi:uncharacterized protein CDAR_521701 [Caerostris darwini]|uniref:Uncharacterized protein n=1 Tax=Caerostris darwini TaxID=1538125 RepID=A0AAV4PB49_9ARAC|nr:uncharacterized protein CDAR_521701 [Caerostris darwini]
MSSRPWRAGISQNDKPQSSRPRTRFDQIPTRASRLGLTRAANFRNEKPALQDSRCMAFLIKEWITAEQLCATGAYWDVSNSFSGVRRNQTGIRLLQKNGRGENNFESNAETLTFEEVCDVNTAYSECPFRVERYYDENRIPRVFLNVICLPPRHDVRNILRHRSDTRCEKVTVEVSVLRNDVCNGGPTKFVQVWEKLSVACVRTVRPIHLRSKPAHTISFKELS